MPSDEAGNVPAGVQSEAEGTGRQIPSDILTSRSAEDRASRSAIDAVIPSFIGQVVQQPPAFSALKVGGRPAYALAREGQNPPLQPRIVQIYSLTITAYAWPYLTIDLHCGRGTYVRAIARDIGRRLGVGGYLQALRRTSVGDFDVCDAVPLDSLRHGDDVRMRMNPFTNTRQVLRTGDGSL
jgi:tRNA pseudouridine55 synthase